MGFHAMIGNSVHGDMGKLTYAKDDKLPRVPLEPFLLIGNSSNRLQRDMGEKCTRFNVSRCLEPHANIHGSLHGPLFLRSYAD